MPGESSVIEGLLQLGLPGIIILVLAWVVYKQSLKLDALHTEKFEIAKTMLTKAIETVERNTAALDDHREVISDLARGVQAAFPKETKRRS